MATTSSGSTEGTEGDDSESAVTSSPPCSKPVDYDPSFEELSSLHPEWLDEIRFMSYRIASKLRLLQRRTGLVYIDIWNVIEAFRENCLNVVDSNVKISRSRLETLVGTLYANLAKRLPHGRHADMESMASWLLSWLLTALNPSRDEAAVELKLRTVKTALALLCTGKLVDKLRYVFTLISDDDGHAIPSRHASFVRDAARIPKAVGEDFQTTIEQGSVVSLNDFLEILSSDTAGPLQCLSWLPVLHRIAATETFVHRGFSCDSCGVKDFRGLRYKSDRSKCYNLCQWCFWRGRIPQDHRDDVFKEFNSSPRRKASYGSLRCIGGKGGGSSRSSRRSIPKFPEQDEHRLDLTNMIPSPLPSPRSLSNNSSFLAEEEQEEGEHQLIARYAHEMRRVKARASGGDGRSSTSCRELVRELEKKNQEIMSDIKRLKRNRSSDQPPPPAAPIVSELHGLMNHKMNLESRLDELQCTRKDLMAELDELMKVLRVQPTTSAGHLQHYATQQQQSPMMVTQLTMSNANASIAEINAFTNVSGMDLENHVQQFAMAVDKPATAPPSASPLLRKGKSGHPQRKASKKRLEKSKAIIIDEEVLESRSKPPSSFGQQRSASVVSLSD